MIRSFKNFVWKIDRWACMLGNICIVVNMLVVVFNIIMRNLFNASLAGITDYAGFISCLIVVFSLGFREPQGRLYRGISSGSHPKGNLPADGVFGHCCGRYADDLVFQLCGQQCSGRHNVHERVAALYPVPDRLCAGYAAVRFDCAGQDSG